MLLVATVLAVSAAVFVAALTLQTNASLTRRVVRERTVGAGSAAAELRTNPLFRTLPRIEPLSERAKRIKLDLERAGLPMTVTEFTGLRAVSAAVVSIAVLVLSDALGVSTLLGAIVAISGFILGFHLPSWYLNGRKKKRLSQLDDQLVEVLTSMAKSLRTGLGFLQALDYALRETPPPLGPELGRVLREIQLGADIEVVLEEMNRRLLSHDLEIAATAIIIQRRVGGNLSEILNNVANTIRERRELRREVLTLTARQRLTANAASLLPVLLACVLFLINPDTTKLLFTDTAGRIALMLGVGFEILGLWLIRRLSVIEV